MPETPNTQMARIEKCLEKLAGGNVQLPEPATLIEKYLKTIAETGAAVGPTVSGTTLVFPARPRG